MTKLQKVIWSEGLFLTPHHFQQWDRYHEDLVSFRIRALTTFFWGAEELKFSEEALENGVFEVARCRAILPRRGRRLRPERGAQPLGADSRGPQY